MLYMMSMREVNLRSVDLNLLVALEALLDEKNVTRAAHRLGISQPAASRALARLRTLFSDALLVDGPRGYILSSRAEGLQPALQQTLAGIGAMLASSSFDPRLATGPIRIMMTDLDAAVLAPRLLARLALEAPQVDLHILPPGPSFVEALESAATDAVIGVVDEAPAGIQRRKLYEDRFVTIMRAGHPAGTDPLTMERYLALDHIVISITGTGPAPVDELLSVSGDRRRVRVRVPNFLAALEIAAVSDLVMTLPASLAKTATGASRFVMLPPPFDPGRISLSLVWHARQQDAPKHIWLRRTIVAAAVDLTASVQTE
jgi:DNA-binding transcriptional LysR family regulator